MFSIHNTFEKNGFYRDKKDIHYSDFLSVIISSLNIKESKYAEYFHENYRQNIALEFKRDAVSLSAALIAFSKQKYNEAIEHLGRVTYKYAYFYLKSKETLVKIYYEQKEFELLESVIDACKHYLKRHKDILYMHYDRYMMFFNFVIRISKTSKKDKPAVKELMHELDTHRSVIGRDWLLEKLIEMK